MVNFEKLMNRLIKKRLCYNNEEMNKLNETGFLKAFDEKAMHYWLKVEPICSKHCSGLMNEGRPYYFNPMGLLIKRKCPSGICIHGLAQLSPIIYSYYDHMLRGADPKDIIFNHITCTDIGLEWGGLGNNLFRVTYEKMPFLEYMRFMLSNTRFLFKKNKKARGKCQTLEEYPLTGGPEPNEFMRELPLEKDELDSFLVSPRRVKRLLAIEKFQNYHIVVSVVKSKACIAGHKEGDEFLMDSMGRVLPTEDKKGICIMALNKIWYRILLIFDRMAENNDGKPDFTGTLFDLPMNCYGAGLPAGACGEILMKVSVRES